MLEVGISTTFHDLEFNSATRANLKLSHLEEKRRMTHNLPSCYVPTPSFHYFFFFFFFWFCLCQSRFHPLFYTRIKSTDHQHQASQPPLHIDLISHFLPAPRVISLLPPPLHNLLNRSALLLPLNPTPPHIPNLDTFPAANAASQSSSSLTPDAGPTIKNDFLHLSTVIVPGRGGFARLVESEAVVEFGRGQEDSFWVGVEREGLGRGDDACFAEFGRFAEVWIFFREKRGEIVRNWRVFVDGGGGRGGERGEGGWRLGG